MDRTGLSAVLDRIGAAARRAGRVSDAIDLVVVTKYASDVAVQAVIDDGATRLGESRADGIERRATRFPELEWHFIGHLQRNKVNRVRPATSVLHSLDSVRLAAAWARQRPCPPAFVQVDLAGEPQKGGVSPRDLPALLEACGELGIEVPGLMVIPPKGETPEDARPWFARLRHLRDEVVRDHPGVSGLSMGMSEDFEVAVEEGASVLRVGRAILEPFEDDED
jgi:pyridoxal phosphate enzyme (YggS family)